MSQADELLTIEDAADILGRSTTTLYLWRSKNSGPISFRRGRRLMYRSSDVAAFALKERVETTRGVSV
ncbi:MAG: helix-turn-helix domain-containing protein [Mycolicibacterium cosmeticum]|nr:helix-turn-helix domain-containing protein [Mycolicibacterium cosmeticum]